VPDLYPAVGFYFAVRVAELPDDGVGFSDVSGLDTERELEEIKEGGENGFIYQVPGRVRHGNLVLKRGILSSSTALFRWCASVLESDLGTPIRPKTIVVSLLSEKAAPLITWSVASAWPVKWNVSELKANEGTVAMETLEFAYTTITRTYGAA
jgi:phage tail-like protein